MMNATREEFAIIEKSVIQLFPDGSNYFVGGFKWLQLVPRQFQMGSVNFGWFQVVQVVPRFSKYIILEKNVVSSR